MGKFEKHTSYIFLAGTVILFGISIYLLLSGGSSQGVTWGRFGDRMQGTIDGYSTLLLACVLLFLSLWMRRNRSKGFTFSQGEPHNLIAKDVDADQVLEYLSPAGYSDAICLFIENRNNRHILQLKDDGSQDFLISLSDRKNRLYHLINPKRTVNRQMGFTLKQASGVVEDYFHSGNLLKNGKYVWVRESEKENYN